MIIGTQHSWFQVAVAAIWLLVLVFYLASTLRLRAQRQKATSFSRVTSRVLPSSLVVLVVLWQPLTAWAGAMVGAAGLLQLGLLWRVAGLGREHRTDHLPVEGDPQRQIKQMELAFNVRDQINWVISRETDEAKLFHEVCKVLVQMGRFHLSWIGWVDGHRIRPVAAAVSPKFAASHPPLLEKLDLSNEPSSSVLMRGLSAPSTQFDGTCKPGSAHCPWIGEPRFPDPFSAAILPLSAASGRRAVLVIATRHPNAMPSRMLAQFDNLARTISWALDSYSQARERERALQRNRVLSSAVEQSADAICIFEADGAIRYVNSRFRRLTGYDNKQILGQSPRVLCASEQDALQFDGILKDLQRGLRWRGELYKRKRCGEGFRTLETIAPLRDDDGKIIRFISTSEDVTALRYAQARIEELAYYDALTGLANRQLLITRLREKIESTQNAGRQIALLVLDLDRFKSLNDSLGHEAGDKFLRLMASRLSRLAGEGETAARLGGDEFALLIVDVEGRDDVARRAEQVFEAMRELVEINDVAFNGSVSIGAALAPEHAQEADQLLRLADLAMYRAKKIGRGSFQVINEDISRAAMAEIGLEHQLKIAVREGQLMPFYQPIWDADCQVLGFEALARWPLADGTMVSPAEFIPLAEDVGLIEAIGEQMLHQACRDVATLSRQYGRRFFVSINLSAMQLQRPDSLMAALKRALDESGLAPDCLELELTESMLVQEVDAALAVLHSLRQLGVRLVIDDFGTGYSSLTYLSQFPVDKLKIDKSFVDAIDSSRGRMITSAIIALGSRLEMRVVAEGVENQEQRDTLAELGCDQFQGFWFSRPLALNDLVTFMATR